MRVLHTSDDMRHRNDNLVGATVEELDDDQGWETVAKPSSKASQVQDKLDEAVRNLELVEDGAVQHQQKFHKPTPAAGRGRGYGRSTLRTGRGGRPGSFGPEAPHSERKEANVRVVPRPPPRPDQHAQPEQGPPQHRGRNGGRGRGRGRRGPHTPFASQPYQGAPTVQAGFQPSPASQEAVQQSSKPQQERYHARRGRTSALRGGGNTRRPGSNKSESEQTPQTSAIFKSAGDSSHHETPHQAPTQIQFGQFAAGSFNPN